MFIRISCLFLVWTSSVARADWPTYQHDVRRSGATDESLAVDRLKPLWSWSSNEPPRPAWAGPALWDAYAGIRDLPAMRDYDAAPQTIIADGRVFFGSTTDDTMRCLDAATGELQWQFTVDAPVRLAPTYERGKLLFGSDDGYVYCLEAATGQQRWRYSPQPPERWIINNGRLISPHPIRTGVIAMDGQVYFGAGLLPWESSFLCSLDLATGEVERGYRHELSNKTLEGPPAATDDQLVFPQGRIAPQLFARSNGKDLGALQKSSGGSIVIVAEDQLLHGPGADSRRGGIATSDAKQRQRIATFGRGNAMVVDDGVAYMAADGKLAAAHLRSRKSLWTADTDTLLSLIKAGDMLVAGGVDEVSVYQASDGKRLWTHPIRGRVKGLACAGGLLLASTDEGLLVAFGNSNEARHSLEGISPPDPTAGDSRGQSPPSNVEPLDAVTKVDEAGMLGRWLFRRDQTRGRVVADQSGGASQPGRLEGPFAWHRGRSQEAIQWDGSGSAIIHADHNQARLPKREMTVEALVRVDKPQTWGGIAGVIQDNGAFERGWLLGYRDDHFCFAVAGVASPAASRGKLSYLTDAASFQSKSWHHVVGVYDGQVMRLYVDGKLNAESKEQAGDIWYPPKSYFELGAYHDDNEYYRLTGQLHEVRLYQRALGAEEVSDHFARAKKQRDGLSVVARLKLSRLPLLHFVDEQTASVQWELPAVEGRPSAQEQQGWLRWWEVDESKPPVHRYVRGERQAPSQRYAATIGPLRPNRRYHYQVVLGEQQSQEFPCDTFFNYRPHRPALSKATRGVGEQDTAAWLAESTVGGLCLVWGAEFADDAVRLTRHFRVLVIDDDKQRIDALRHKWIAEGIYGSMLTVRHTPTLSEIDPRLPGDWANLILASEFVEASSQSKAGWRSALRSQLKPGGGRALGLAKLHASSGDGGLKVAPDGRRWRSIERPALKGAGDWSHLYGDAGNSAFAGESLGGAKETNQLQVQWIGRPGPRYQADRSGRKPSPLSTDGRLFLQGWRRIVALDAHNGEPLWSWELPEFERFNVPRDCSNWCADDANVYAAISDQLYQFNAVDGNVQQRFQLPNRFRRSADSRETKHPWAWGFSARSGSQLIGSVVRRDAMWTDFWGNAAAGWYDAKSGDVTSHVVSDALFGYQVADGSRGVQKDDGRDMADVSWSHPGLIVNASITAADHRLWFLECRNPALQSGDKRRLQGDDLWKHLVLVCLDAENGEKQWELPLEAGKFAEGSVMVSMCRTDGRLVLLTSGSSHFHVYALDDRSGRTLWSQKLPWGRDHHGGHMSRPAVVNGVVYVRPFSLALADGKILSQRLPVGGCGTYACTTDALFFRQSTVTMWNRETARQSTWSRLRPDCWLSTIPAAGMLLSPEGGGGCSCGTWLETSVGFKPR